MSPALPALIYRQLSSGEVWSVKGDAGPYDGLIRALEGPEHAELAAACAEMLTDPDPGVRTGLVACLPWFGDTLGAEGLATLLEQRPELFVRVAPVGADPGFFSHRDLAKGVLSAMATLVQPSDRRAIAQLRRAAADPQWGSHVLWSLARVDGDWLLAHADLVPHAAYGTLVPLRPEQRTSLIQALAPWPAQVVKTIPSAFWKQFPGAEAVRLQGLLAGAAG
ncbi:MAG: hypothetical protein ACAI44_33750 [Candidatus Sericytochromatia bacterium]